MKVKRSARNFASLAWLISCSTGLTQGTAFTYQGRLNDAGNPANGNYDLTFSLFDAGTAGTQAGQSLTNAVAVSNGLFTVALDFGALFDGTAYWLEIGVQTNGGPAFTPLAPRQPLTPAPYAITAANLSGSLSASRLTGTLLSAQLAGTYSAALTFDNPADTFRGAFSGDGSGLTGVNALTLGGFSASSFWKLGGNAGTTPGINFLGTTDNQALELKVNNARAVRLEPTASVPNVILGSQFNRIGGGFVGTAIGGGSGNIVQFDPGLLDGTAPEFAIIAGGTFNHITNGWWGVIGGGAQNLIVSGQALTISGGSENQILRCSSSTISGGTLNDLEGGNDLTIGGGSQNQILQAGSSTIAGGYNSSIGAGSFGASIAGGSQNIIGPGTSMATIGGGKSNSITGYLAGTISGGQANLVSASLATIPGGYANVAGGAASFAAGQFAQATTDGSFVWNSFASPNLAPQDHLFSIYGRHGLDVEYYSQTPAGAGTRYVYFGDLFPGYTIYTWSGARLTDGGIWTNASDRDRKTDFTDVQARDVLEKLARLPVRQWRYTNEVSSVRHLGPTAQDFKAAFGLGTDDKSIGTLDESGVALAAIQGLNSVVKERDQKIERLEKSVARLSALVDKLTRQQAEQER